MEEKEIRAALESHWSASAAGDQDAEPISTRPTLCDYPQSGERTWRLCAATIPANLQVSRHSDSGIGQSLDHGVHLHLPEPPGYIVGIVEFGNGKVVHETQYFADPFEAPAWLAKWVKPAEVAEVCPLNE